mgnify:CR=1 FL=1
MGEPGQTEHLIRAQSGGVERVAAVRQTARVACQIVCLVGQNVVHGHVNVNVS